MAKHLGEREDGGGAQGRGVVVCRGEGVARGAAVLRRYRPDPSARANDGLHIDGPAARATWNGKGLDLTPVEYRLLRTLLATPGRIWARDELLDRLYLDHRVVVDRTVDSHIRNVRQKALDAGYSDVIQTVRRVGLKIGGCAA